MLSPRKSLDKEREKKSVSLELPRGTSFERKPCQVTVLGYPGVGKTSLCNVALGSGFNKDYNPTPTLVSTSHRSGLGLDIILVDTSGQAFLPGNDSLMKNLDRQWHESELFALIYSCDSRESFQALKDIKSKIPADKKYVLVCNKAEKKEKGWKVPMDEAKKLGDEFGCSVYFVSAKKKEMAFDGIVSGHLNLAPCLATSPREGSGRKKSLSGRIGGALNLSGKGSKAKEVASPRTVTSGEFSRSPTQEGAFTSQWAGFDLQNQPRNDDETSTEITASVPAQGCETTDSHEFLDDDLDEETKRKIRAARRRYEKQGCGDGGWDQARIVNPKAAAADDKPRTSLDLDKPRVSLDVDKAKNPRRTSLDKPKDEKPASPRDASPASPRDKKESKLRSSNKKNTK